MVDFLRHHAAITGLPVALLLRWLALCPRKFHRWQDRYGKLNEHNAMIPRDHWIEPHERAYAAVYQNSAHRQQHLQPWPPSLQLAPTLHCP